MVVQKSRAVWSGFFFTGLISRQLHIDLMNHLVEISRVAGVIERVGVQN